MENRETASNKPDLTLQAFEKFLRKKRKTGSGDKLTEKTIELYLYRLSWYTRKQGWLQREPSELAVAMKNEVERTQNNVVRSVFINYLLSIEAPSHLIDIIRTIKITKANAQTSQRYLQSKVLTRKEVLMLIRQEPDIKVKLAIKLLYDTGCRRAELLGIRVKDIDFQMKDQDKANGIYGEIYVMGKGQKARHVYISKETKDMILTIIGTDKLKRRNLLFQFFKDKKKKHLYKNQWKALYDKIKVSAMKVLGKHVHPHMFRHTTATHMAESGASAEEVRDSLGHSSVRTTEIYEKASKYRAKQGFSKYHKEHQE